MSFYIDGENQKTLWNVISNMPLFMNIFGGNQTKESLYTDTLLKRELVAKQTMDIEAGQQWFRKIIQNFYESNRSLPLSALSQINKSTIAYMINELKTMSPHVNTMVSREMPPASFETHNIINDKKMAVNAFEKRQQDYENMFKRPAPPEIDFRESAPDGVINNMDELLKQHMDKREEELRKYAPPVSAVTGPPREAVRTSVQIRENVPLESENINVIDTQNDANETGTDIQNIIQFLKPLDTRHPVPKNEMAELRELILNLSEKMTSFDEKMTFLENEIKQVKPLYIPSNEETVEPSEISEEDTE